jgi:hypothetical protein
MKLVYPAIVGAEEKLTPPVLFLILVDSSERGTTEQEKHVVFRQGYEMHLEMRVLEHTLERVVEMKLVVGGPLSEKTIYELHGHF